ncbi:MAG: hypothetical protein A3B69_00215 [Gammaproteobacteria bacterium RIFCSPHIGHO2_02_FULL_38_33]|nr:MAG: hypothetical protein A3B69_00215 [Gammaproteobacteria bacterium RIFCSPHIGHO2_02_FULL_38_33]
METQPGVKEITRGEKDVHLDLIRGLAALGVFLGHARNIFLGVYPQSSSLLVKLFIFSAGFGAQMVMIFFVLSGYCIALSVLSDIKKNSWSWKKYLINRSVRLYVVLLPALLLTLFWDYLGIFISNNASIYQGIGPQNVVPRDVFENINASVFFGNLFFLQGVFTSFLGSNSPLWSLSYEYWYYMAFSLLLLIFFRASDFNKKVIYAVILATIAYVFWVFIYLFPVWLFGACLAFIPRNDFLKMRRFFWIFLVAALVFFVVCMTLSRFSITAGLTASYSIGFATSFLIYVLLHDIRNSQGYYAKITSFFANMSYTVYLTHLPFLVFLYAVFVREGRWSFDAIHFFKFTGILFFVLFYSYLISRITERKTGRVKSFFYSYFLDKRLEPVLLKE